MIRRMPEIKYAVCASGGRRGVRRAKTVPIVDDGCLVNFAKRAIITKVRSTDFLFQARRES